VLRLVDPYTALAERSWSELASRSYFLSWGWIENWLACLPRDRAPQLALWDDGRAACFLGRRFRLRRGVVPTRTLHLNTTGDERLDDLWVEYNGMVGDEPTLPELIDALPSGWDELFLPGLREDAFGGVTDGRHGRYRILVERRVTSRTVDLDRVRAGGFAALLSGQTRSQLRRAQRLVAPITVEVAGDAARALAIYDELCALHAAHWRTRADPGAFADPWIDRFHRRLIARRFAAGEIRLVRIASAHGTIGCLYNFVYQNRVLQYQSGFARSDDPHHKPGYVCHAAAIEHDAAAGLAVYDWLAGDARYKKSLSTGATIQLWARVQRRALRFALEDRILRAVRYSRRR